jgi:hypothetical protein
MDHIAHLTATELRPLGINLLTGEAEGIWGLGRVLCDLTAEAAGHFEEFMGGTVHVNRKGKHYIPGRCTTCGSLAEIEQEGSNWNPSVGSEPAVASVMLTDSTLLDFAVFILVKRHGRIRLGRKNGAHCGIWIFDTEAEEKERWPQVKAVYGLDDGRVIEVAGTAGTRNRHEMSGRVA